VNFYGDAGPTTPLVIPLTVVVDEIVVGGRTVEGSAAPAVFEGVKGVPRAVPADVT